MVFGIAVLTSAYALYAVPAQRLLLPAGTGVLTRPSDTAKVMPRVPSSTPPPVYLMLDTPKLASLHVSYFVTLTLVKYVY